MATGTTVFSRVTVVAPTTRIDLALPSDVSVADLLPMLLEMARETTPDGGSRHGGWVLARLGDSQPLEPNQSLSAQGIVDGDMLQLRRGADNPPPPLYDDVVDALAEAEPGSYRPWTKETAAKVGHTAGALAMIGAAAALGLAGPAGLLHHLDTTTSVVYQIVAAVIGVVVAIFATGVGSIVTRAYAAPTTGTVIAAAGGLPFAFVAGFNIVPGNALEPRLLLASALTLIFASVSIMVIGAGIVTFIAAATAGAFGTIAFIIATLVPQANEAGIAAGAAAIGLAGISLLPRITIQLAKLPLPHVPGSAEDLKEDTGFPDYRMIERQTGLAHQYMTGLIVGCGVVAAIGAVVAAAFSPIWGAAFAVVVSAVLLLRGRNYANGSQAIALLFSGLLSSLGVTIGLLAQVGTMPIAVAWVFPPLLLLGVLSIIFGVVFPNRRFSPVQRRMVDILEAVLIALVLPLALAAMDLYMYIRDLNINF
ncbi:type VII secretion integral membrane protein EccD [Saccharopolyspora hirsuta]|uniref:Type VII secretion integral membrane protein EccD n=1 Tax=Saccharopolyspora hirsuta TaxID=1837 RepID=A0A5M7BTB2_SACHI|nr:type VII secretion integral membrane protein EccD [Saccharopolyspora hirsuta]KAA5833456.1 type VII secretion integral membrane protein EccD [Saccharopolyspora hirsuta]MBF6507865.1 type VII secretion integral membrane protein EccD [Nocardia farcinica]